MGLKVNAGIRPEDLLESDSENCAFVGTVEIMEALGEVTQLYFARSAPEKAPVIAKLPGIHKDLRGQTVALTALPEKVHLFHNGLTLRR